MSRESRGTIGRGGDISLSTRSGAVKSTEPPAREDDEVKATKSFLKGINTLTFSPQTVALTIFLAHPALQVRMMEIFRAWLDLLEGAFDRDQYQSNAHHDLMRDAKRINDAMRPFEE